MFPHQTVVLGFESGVVYFVFVPQILFFFSLSLDAFFSDFFFFFFFVSITFIFYEQLKKKKKKKIMCLEYHAV